MAVPAIRYDSPAIAILKVALGETVSWCSTRPSVRLALAVDEADPSLRSMRLLPPLFASSPNSAVFRVVESRWYALGSPRRDAGRVDLAGGRLLYYEPGRNLSDGAACLASGGLFDVENIPPWDTWLCFTDDGRLVSWVPPELVDRAAAGIDVNPEMCIEWAADSSSLFSHLLRAEGILEGEP